MNQIGRYRPKARLLKSLLFALFMHTADGSQGL